MPNPSFESSIVQYRAIENELLVPNGGQAQRICTTITVDSTRQFPVNITHWDSGFCRPGVFVLLCVRYAACCLVLIFLLPLVIIEVNLSSIVLAQFKNWRSMKAFPRSQNGMRVSIRNLGILA